MLGRVHKLTKVLTPEVAVWTRPPLDFEEIVRNAWRVTGGDLGSFPISPAVLPRIPKPARFSVWGGQGDEPSAMRQHRSYRAEQRVVGERGLIHDDKPGGAEKPREVTGLPDNETMREAFGNSTLRALSASGSGAAVSLRNS